MKRWISTSARVGLLLNLLLGMLGVASATWDPASRISTTMASTRDVASYSISPDATSVIYTADVEIAGRRGMYTVPIGGGAGHQVVSTPVEGGSIYQYGWTPDSSKVVYIGEVEALGSARVYSMDADGSNWQAIDDGLPGMLVSIDIVNNTYVIVYTLTAGNAIEMYSARIDGVGSGVRLNKTLPVGGNVVQSEATADGQWVVYRADATTDEDFQLFSVRIDGTNHQLLSGININGGDVRDFTLAPDSNHVVWTGDLLVDERVDLFSWTVDKTGLIGFLDSAGDNVERPLVSPDSQWVAYVTDSLSKGDKLFFTPIASSEPQASSLYFFNKTNIASFAFSPDSRHLVFIYDAGIVGKRVVEADAILENTPAQTLSGSTDILDFEITPDSRSVVMRSNDKSELMITPIDSVSAFTLTDLAAGRSVEQYAVTPQGDYVIYRADRNLADTVELFAVPARAKSNMAAQTAKLNGIFNTTNDVTSFQLSSQGDVVYRADSAADDDKFELFSRINQHQVFLPLVVR